MRDFHRNSGLHLGALPDLQVLQHRRGNSILLEHVDKLSLIVLNVLR